MKNTDDVYEEWEDADSDNPWIRSYLARKKLSDTLRDIRYSVNLPARLADTSCFTRLSRLMGNRLFIFTLIILPIAVVVSLFLRSRICNKRTSSRKSIKQHS
ncbi:hypothetical protein [Tropheryma whipplei]|uniref:hypothetical protein n=2 Tax=Tropheryma whipplei TaxID=2039 RepID=UPI0004B0837A|nr:hypothetical protein [Tropheryma whipplei]MCO8190482.1 hypothetical protein [Tropheryma whipplei]